MTGHANALILIRQHLEALWDATEVPLDEESIARRLKLKADIAVEERFATDVQDALRNGYRYGHAL